LNKTTSSIVLEVSGEDLTVLENEIGGHRIQRIPPTERKGRVHTSTVTVTLLDEIQKAEFVFNEKDFKIEWFSGTGGGGQHRNKHQNSCRLIHRETGEITTSQCRSRENSFNEAKLAMIKKLQDKFNYGSHLKFSEEKKRQAGSGERGDKIRTYMFQHDKVIDHRTEKSCTTSKIMCGKFDILW